jgi:hypothetical protein
VSSVEEEKTAEVAPEAVEAFTEDPEAPEALTEASGEAEEGKQSLGNTVEDFKRKAGETKSHTEDTTSKESKKPSAAKSKTAGVKAKIPSAKATKVAKSKEVADNLGDGEQLCDAGKVTEAAHTTIKVNDAEVAIIEAIEINEVRRLWSTVEVTEHRGDCQNQGRGRRGRGFDEVGGNHKDDGIACEGCGGCKRAAGRDV